MPNQTFPPLHRRREEFGGEEELEVLDFFFFSEENCGASDEKDVRGREGGRGADGGACNWHCERSGKEENETDEEEGKERDKTRECVRSFAAIGSKVAVRRKKKGLDVLDIVVVVVPSNNRALLFRSLESGFMYCTRFVLRYYSRSSIGGGGIRKRRDRSPWLPQQKRGIPYPWGSRKGAGLRPFVSMH